MLKCVHYLHCITPLAAVTMWSIWGVLGAARGGGRESTAQDIQWWHALNSCRHLSLDYACTMWSVNTQLWNWSVQTWVGCCPPGWLWLSSLSVVDTTRCMKVGHWVDEGLTYGKLTYSMVHWSPALLNSHYTPALLRLVNMLRQYRWLEFILTLNVLIWRVYFLHPTVCLYLYFMRSSMSLYHVCQSARRCFWCLTKWQVIASALCIWRIKAIPTLIKVAWMEWIAKKGLWCG